MYVATKELRKRAIKAKGENMKLTSGIRVTFILEIKLQKYIFGKMWQFFNGNVSFLNPC